jgi:hypothetical protein
MYVKIYQQILDGTLGTKPNLRHFFMDMLVLADSSGVVDATHEAISRRTGWPIDKVYEFTAELMKDDPYSRSFKARGARLVLVDPGQREWGWRIVNYKHYRDVKDEATRRSYFRGRNRIGYVYYAVCPDRVRIGHSPNPWARVAELKKVYPDIELAAKEPGNADLLHRRRTKFAADSIGQGWFKLTAELQDHVAAVAVAGEESDGMSTVDNAEQGVVGVASVAKKVAKRSQASPSVASVAKNSSQHLPMKPLTQRSHGVAKRSQASPKNGGTEAEAEAEAYPFSTHKNGSTQGISTSTLNGVGADPNKSNQHQQQKFDGLTDSEWLARLAQDGTYQGIDVPREFGKMANWCKVNRKVPTRRRFVAWLNRIELVTAPPDIEDEEENQDRGPGGWEAVAQELYPDMHFPESFWEIQSPEVMRRIKEKLL